MKMTYGRKFFAGIFGIIVVVAIYMATLILDPAAISGSVVIFTIGMIVTIVFMYIGGNVWNKWTRSKYFQPHLYDGEEK